MLTSLRVMLFSILGLALGIIPGVIYFVNSSLAVPVVMMENLEGRAAVRRSKTLVKHARFFVVLIIFAQWIIPLASTLIFSPDLKFNEAPPARPSISFTITPSEWLSTTLDVVFMPLLATLSALLYLKLRQLKGERLGDMLEQFEREELPQTNWQKRMRQRLRSSSRHTRSA